MSVTQDYKILTLNRAQVAELTIAIAEKVIRLRLMQDRASTVDGADEYRKRERDLRNIHAVLVAA